MQGMDAIKFLLQASKKFILLVTQYLIQNSNFKALPNSSSFITFLITYINRIIIVDKQFFMTEVLQLLYTEQGLSLQQFFQSWFKKMDFITSRESLRINLIAIYMMIPYFNVAMMR